MKKILTILLTFISLQLQAQFIYNDGKAIAKVDSIRARVDSILIKGPIRTEQSIKAPSFIGKASNSELLAGKDTNYMKNNWLSGTTPTNGFLHWDGSTLNPYLSSTQAGGILTGADGKLFVPNNSTYWDYFVRDSLLDDKQIVYQGEFYAQRFLGYGANLLEATIGEQNISGNYLSLKKTGIELNTYSTEDAIQQPYPTTITPHYDETNFAQLIFGNNGNNITMGLRSGNINFTVPGIINANQFDAGNTSIKDTSIITYNGGDRSTEIYPSRINLGGIFSYGSSFNPIVADGVSAIAWKFNTLNDLVTTGAKLFSIQNHDVEKASIDKDGTMILADDLSYNVRHGLMHISGATYTPDVTQNIPFKLTPGMSNYEPPVGMTLAGDSAVCITTGAYTFSIGITMSGNNSVDWEIAAFVNSVQYTDYFTITTTNTSNFITASWFWYIDLTAGDNVGFKITNLSDSSDPIIRNMKIDYIKLHN